MKTAVSIPDDVFERAERLALKTGKSRSRLFTEALKEYVARHAPDEVTEALDRVWAEPEEPKDRAFIKSSARSTLERNEW